MDDIHNLFKITIDQLHEGIQIVDYDWSYVYVNKAAVSQSRLSADLLLNRRMMDVYPGIEKTEMFAILQQVMRDRQPRQMENHFELFDGESGWFSLYFEPHSMGVLIRSIDITQKKKLEEQYWSSQRLEAVGQFAGGIAHDFNNKLGVIRMLSELALNELGDPQSLKSYLENILTAANQATSFSRQLLNYSRDQMPGHEVLNLNERLRISQDSLRKLLGADINVEYRLDSNLGAVRASASQLDQVLLNLSLNSREAMPKGGSLWIETANVELSRAHFQNRPEIRPGPYVRLTIGDSGIGMTDEVRARVLEPFFSTKKNGKGAGLGLSMVNGIVAQSHGYIDIQSRFGQGTRVEIFLPLVDADGVRISEANVSERSLEWPVPMKEPLGRETVLLVEDDMLLRAAFELALKGAGYRVIAASNIEDVENHLSRHSHPIPLLVTDVVLPKIGGVELARRMKSRHQGIKIIFVSGYNPSSLPQLGEFGGDYTLLQKPVSVRQFLTSVRRTLDEDLA